MEWLPALNKLYTDPQEWIKMYDGAAYLLFGLNTMASKSNSGNQSCDSFTTHSSTNRSQFW